MNSLFINWFVRIVLSYLELDLFDKIAREKKITELNAFIFFLVWSLLFHTSTYINLNIWMSFFKRHNNWNIFFFSTLWCLNQNIEITKFVAFIDCIWISCIECDLSWSIWFEFHLCHKTYSQTPNASLKFAEPFPKRVAL